MSCWYVVHCKPGCDREALENLVRQGYEVYRPMITRTVRRNHSSVIEYYSMFPRYLFIRNEVDGINSMAVNSTRGVSRIVAFAGVNGSVADSDIDRIRAAELEIRACTQRIRRADCESIKLKFSRFSDIPRDILTWSDERRVVFLLNAIQSREEEGGPLCRQRSSGVQ